MRILMLGWEFPPFISGGLGTACYGLTKAMDRLGHRVQFVLPKPVEHSHASHVELLHPSETGETAPLAIDIPVRAAGSAVGGGVADAPGSRAMQELTSLFRHVEFHSVPSAITSPYPGASIETIAETLIRLAQQSGSGGGASLSREALEEIAALREAGVDLPELRRLLAGEANPGGAVNAAAGPDYAGDVVGHAERYARLVLSLCRGMKFDVIHAHDWMTYPAGMAIARLSGKPLVVHIHSTEFDRSGEHVNQRVYDIERRGMHAAIRVIAVSMLTKSVCVRRYGVDPDKIEVVYNGIDVESGQPNPSQAIGSKDKIVLFLGRITMQKGPEYFVRAAKRVLEKMDNVKFIVAGNGDQARRMIEHAAEIGIGSKVLFTGFLRGKDVARVFRMADLYVMPSVSEPFGIAPLEAMCQDTPVLISKQSGVSEVLSHVLKVDFWDTDEMANKIIAVLRHPPLSQTLRQHGKFEVRKLTWEGAAERCIQVYRDAIGLVTPREPRRLHAVK